MSVRRRKDGRWRVDVVIKRGGKRLRERKAAPTRAEGLALEREIRTRLETGARPGVKAPLFADWGRDFVDTYAVNNNKPSEVESKRQIIDMHLAPFFGSMRLDDIGLEAIERFKAQQLGAKPPLAPKTVNNHLTVLRRMLSLAVEWGRLASVPRIRWLHVPEQRFDFLTTEEADRLIAGAAPEWRCMVVLGLRCGLRQGELLALSWDDVDLVAGQITVRRAVARGVLGSPKGKRTRHVPLSDGAAAALREQQARTKLAGEWVHGGASLLRKGECKWPLWTACRRAGLRRVGWHVLRHSFASQLVMAKVPLKAVQELLGHVDIKQTMRYAHLSPDVRRDAVRLLDAPAARGREAKRGS